MVFIMIFFIPELEKFVGEEKMKFFKDKLLKEDHPSIFTSYDQKRQEGENDSYICLLIHQDSVVEFISHINNHNISPLSQIIHSKNAELIHLFESNEVPPPRFKSKEEEDKSIRSIYII